nr:hypothetical protein [Cellulomonas sp. zg-ZUI22]
MPLPTDAGVRTLVPDQRGYSPGARPRGRRPYAVRELVADVVALLDAAERALLADDGARRAHRRDRVVPRAPARRVGDRACRPGPDDVRLGPSGPVLRTGVDLDADHWLPEHRPADVAAAVLGQVRA